MFERDLRKLRAKRAEREKAAGILTRPAGVTKHQSPKIGAKKSHPKDDEDKMERGVDVKSAENPQTATEVITEQVAAGELPRMEAQASHDVPQATNEGTTVTTLAGNQAMDPTAGLAITLQPESQDPGQLPAKRQQAETNTVEQPSLNPIDEPQPVGDQETAPFESMFNDLENPSNPTSLDFDLGFPSAGAMSQDLLNDAVFESMAASNNDQNLDLAPTTAEDIDTLLPGLDNYVNDNGDFSLINMELPTAVPETSAIHDTSVPAPAAANDGTQQQQSLDSAPMESNFEDLFGSGDWGMDDDMGGGTIGNFDEDWFKTDG